MMTVSKGSKLDGFTLVEVTMVIVVLGIIMAIGSQFIASSIDSYRTAEVRSKLVQRGRLSIEQITRELHMALPNAIRISASGNCIEFLPIVASANYQKALPDQSNSIAATTNIQTSSFVIPKGTPRYAVVSPFAISEVYTVANPASKIVVGSLASSPYTSIPLASSHRFLRNSVNKRVYLVDDPVRYCVSSQLLMRYSSYGLLTSTLSDTDPGGVADIVSHEVSPSSGGNAFVLSAGSEDTNVALHLNLLFSKGSISIDLNHQILIRNVP